MISKRRAARRMIVEVLSLSRANGNPSLNAGCRGHPCPTKRETTQGFTSDEFRRRRGPSPQQAVTRHREEHREVDRRRNDQRRVWMIGKIRRGVGEMLYIDEVEQERSADNGKNRGEKSTLPPNRNTKFQGIVEVSLMHPRREHEEAKQRDEDREHRGASRSRAPNQIRR